ncbi:hypothetical protein D5E80_18875 [Vibrio parahaemolyticus]|nr:hypothetical protein D5E80_18875 [Vibrio parahaemolyticus]
MQEKLASHILTYAFHGLYSLSFIILNTRRPYRGLYKPLIYFFSKEKENRKLVQLEDLIEASLKMVPRAVRVAQAQTDGPLQHPQ